MIASIFRTIATGIACFAAFALFVLSPAIGSISSIAVVLLSILLSPITVLPGSWKALRAQPAILLLVAVFVSITICFVVTARQPGDALFATNFLGLLLAPVAYLLAVRRPGARTVAIIAALCVAGALVGALTGSYDVFIQGKGRAIGWGSGGNLMARSVVPLGFFALAGVFVTTSRWRWLYLVGPTAAIFALDLTGTRGVFVALPVLDALFIWSLLRRPRVAGIGTIAGFGAWLVAVSSLVLISPRFLGLGGLFEQVATDSTTVSDVATSLRLYMWDAGIHTFLKSPLIGFGWANFTEASKPYGIYMFHSDLLDMAVAAGVIGIISWLAVIAAPLIGVVVMRKDRYANLRLYCALMLSISLAIFGLTDMTLGYDLPTTLYAFMTAAVLGAFREPEPIPAA